MATTDAAAELHAQLEESLRQLVTSDDWLEALKLASRFHDYSFANTQLIALQAHQRGITPTRVAGYRAWQDLGRQVRKGEKGIQILAPVTRTVPQPDTEPDQPHPPASDEKEKRRLVGFRVVRVFDISQTDGDPLPEVRPELVTGDLPQEWDKLATLIAAEGFTLSTVDPAQLGGANGMTSWTDRRVWLRGGLSGAQRFKTGAHELAHIRLHNPKGGTRPACRGVIEVEAESVAFIVSAAAGIDTAGYSLPYVATWSDGDPAAVAATAQRVVTCARDILPALERRREADRTLAPEPIDAPDRRVTGRASVDADRPAAGDEGMYTIQPPDHAPVLTKNGGCATCAAPATHLVIYDGPGRPGTHSEAYHELACPPHADRAQQAGAMTYPTSVIPGYTRLRRQQPAVDNPRTGRLEAAIQRAVHHYQARLQRPEAEPGRQFLEQRRITAESIERFQLGYATPGWRTITNTLKREGFTDQELVAAGISGQAATGRLYDHLRGRVVFPIHDPHGEPVGFAGRLVTGDGPKYLNSPHTDLYRKSELLYAHHHAQPHIVTAGRAVVVEGYTDAIAAHQTGITNTVAIGGTALTQHHLATLRRTTHNITLALDGDPAGQAVADRIPDLADTARLDLDIRVASVPPGRDPADLVTNGDTETLHQAITDAVPLPIHLIDRTLNQHNLNEIEDKVRALHAAGAIVVTITEPEIRETATRLIAYRVGWEPTNGEARLTRYLEEPPSLHRPRRGRSLELGR